GSIVFLIRQDIWNVHHTALDERSARRCRTVREDWVFCPQLLETSNVIVTGHCTSGRSVVTENKSVRCVTEPSGGFDQRIEYYLQIERRTVDDLEHVSSSGLLLQGFAQLIEQACVLDGDDGLSGEVFDQRNLLVSE